MDRDALRELFDYTTFTWASYDRSVRTLPEGAFTRPVERSEWPTLSRALFHIATAWDSWLYERIGIDENPLGFDDAWRDSMDSRVTSSIASWDELQRHRERLRGLLRRVIDETPDYGFHAPSLPIVSGGDPEITPAELVLHILLHERGHHGDVSTLLSALGAEPPGIDYMTYVFFRNRKK